MASLEDLLGSGGGGWQQPGDNVTWPFGAGLNTTRIVAGAATPAELVDAGIDVAILFYISDDPTLLEVGYFWIGGTSHANNTDSENLIAYGLTRYPVPGDPSSPTLANVTTYNLVTLRDIADPTIGRVYFTELVHQFDRDIGNVFAYPALWQFGSVLNNYYSEVVIYGDLHVASPTGSTTYESFYAEGRSKIDSWWCGFSSVANSAALVAADAVVGTTNIVTFRAGRAYRAYLEGQCQTAAANGFMLFRIRKDNLAGQFLGQLGRPPTTVAAIPMAATCSQVFTVDPLNDVTCAIALLGAGQAANAATHVGAANVPRMLNVYDIGDAAHYPDSVILV